MTHLFKQRSITMTEDMKKLIGVLMSNNIKFALFKTFPNNYFAYGYRYDDEYKNSIMRLWEYVDSSKHFPVKFYTNGIATECNNVDTAIDTILSIESAFPNDDSFIHEDGSLIQRKL